MDKKKIIDKVVKLLALADNNDNENQAKAAKDKAAQLMADHNIAIGETTQNSDFKRHGVKLNRKEPIKYDSMLINRISAFNDVVFIKTYSGGRAVNLFVGRPQDIEGNEYMMDVVFQQRTTKWKEFLELFKSHYGRSPKDSEKGNWMKGFAFGVGDKLDELNRLRDNYIEERGLVPVDLTTQILDALKSELDLTEPKTRSIKYHAAGRDAGRETAIHKGVGKQSDIKLIGG